MAYVYIYVYRIYQKIHCLRVTEEDEAILFRRLSVHASSPIKVPYVLFTHDIFSLFT